MVLERASGPLPRNVRSLSFEAQGRLAALGLDPTVLGAVRMFSNGLTRSTRTISGASLGPARLPEREHVLTREVGGEVQGLPGKIGSEAPTGAPRKPNGCAGAPRKFKIPCS
jgi:hypothetical protein